MSSKLAQEVNSVIIALLASEKHPYEIPVSKIARDYRDSNDERIPFRNLGYSSLVDYLASIPGVEIVEIKHNHYINFLGSENSKHVSDLVSKQREKAHSSRNRSRSTGCRKTVPSHFIPRFNQSSGVDYLIIHYISSIVASYPNGLSRYDLQTKLRDMYGIDSTAFNLSEHLKALGSDIRIRDRMIYKNTYCEYKRTKRETEYRERTDQINYQAYGIVNESMELDAHYKSEVCDVDVCDDKFAGEVKVSDCNNYEAACNNNEGACNNNEGACNNNEGACNNNEAACNNYEAACNNYKADCNNYEAEYRYPEEVYRQNQIRHTQHDTSENVNEAVNKREHILTQSKDYVSSVLNKRNKFRLEKLIQSRPEGIWSTELPKLYREEYNLTLEWEGLGLGRFSDFAAHLPEIFHVRGPYSNGDFKLYDAKIPVPEDNHEKKKTLKPTLAASYSVYESDDDIVPATIETKLGKQLYPEDVITIQETVGQISVTDFVLTDAAEGKKPMVEVKVVEAYSPSFFWIHLIKKHRKFMEMMYHLHDFYESNKERYLVPRIMLERGLNIACQFFERWHRGIIRCVDPCWKVTIMFYDYGTIKTYSPEEIFYLNRQFTILPAQAIPCSLYGVIPLEGDKWPRRVRQKFITTIFDRPIWATIIKTDIEKNSMFVILTDTSGEEDLIITDFLLERKLARPGTMVRIRPSNFLYKRYLQCKNARLNSLNNNQSQFSESPLSNRLMILQKLRKLSTETTPTEQTKCETCGHILEKPLERKIKADKNNPDKNNNDFSTRQETPITYTAHNFINFDRPIEKVACWIEMHEKRHFKENDIKNYTEINNLHKTVLEFDNLSSTDSKLTYKIDDKRKLPESNKSYLKYPKIVEKSGKIPQHHKNSKQCPQNQAVELNPQLKIKSKANYNENIRKASELISKEFDRYSSSSESVPKEKMVISQPTTSTLVKTFGVLDNVGELETLESPLEGPRLEPIDWDEVQAALKARQLEKFRHQEIEETKHELLKPEMKTRQLEEMNKLYKNFINEYSSGENENVFKWKADHKIVKSDVITPMVIKTLNSINKSFDSLKVVVPNEVKEVLDRDSLLSSTETSSASEENYEEEIKSQKLEKMNEKLSDEEVCHRKPVSRPLIEEIECSPKSISDHESNFICNATVSINILERYKRLHGIMEKNFDDSYSTLDSDDEEAPKYSPRKDLTESPSLASRESPSNASTESPINSSKESPSKDDKSSINESINEDYKYETLESSGGFSDLNITAENGALELVDPNSVPVFHDNDIFSDESDMASELDVYIPSEFLSNMFQSQLKRSIGSSQIQEVNSEDKNNSLSGNSDELNSSKSSIQIEEECVNPEDRSLYIEDYGEYYASENGVVEAIFPTTPLPEFTRKLLREQIMKEIDKFTVTILKIHLSLINNNTETIAHKLIKNSLYDDFSNVIFKLISSTLNFESNVTSLDIHNTSCNLNQGQLSGIDSNMLTTQLDIKDESPSAKSRTYNIPPSNSSNNNQLCKLSEESNQINSTISVTNLNQYFDTNNNTIDEIKQIGNPKATSSIINSPSISINSKKTSREKLEFSISDAVESFFLRIDANNTPKNKDRNSFINKLDNTNPFKEDLLSTVKEPEKKAPPLPPRPANLPKMNRPEEVKLTSPSSKIVYKAGPVMYNLENGSKMQDGNGSTAVDEKLITFVPGQVNGSNLNFAENNIDGLSLEDTGNLSAMTSNINGATNNQVNGEDKTSDSNGKDQEKLSNENNQNFNCIFDRGTVVQPQLQAIQLSKHTIFNFYFDCQVWIMLDQFRTAFTAFDCNEAIIHSVWDRGIPFKSVDKNMYPIILKLYTSIHKSVEMLTNDEVDELVMLPRTSILKLLLSLKIISSAEMKNIMEDSSYAPSQLILDVNKLLLQGLVFHNSQKIRELK